MYVCLCNALTDRQVRQAVADGACRPREVYGACACRAQCGGCTNAILCLIREARTAAAAAAAAGRGPAKRQRPEPGAGPSPFARFAGRNAMALRDPKVVEHLNTQLTNELTAIN